MHYLPYKIYGEKILVHGLRIVIVISFAIGPYPCQVFGGNSRSDLVHTVQMQSLKSFPRGYGVSSLFFHCMDMVSFTNLSFKVISMNVAANPLRFHPE